MHGCSHSLAVERGSPAAATANTNDNEKEVNHSNQVGEDIRKRNSSNMSSTHPTQHDDTTSKDGSVTKRQPDEATKKRRKQGKRELEDAFFESTFQKIQAALLLSFDDPNEQFPDPEPNPNPNQDAKEAKDVDEAEDA